MDNATDTDGGACTGRSAKAKDQKTPPLAGIGAKPGVLVPKSDAPGFDLPGFNQLPAILMPGKACALRSVRLERECLGSATYLRGWRNVDHFDGWVTNENGRAKMDRSTMVSARTCVRSRFSLDLVGRVSFSCEGLLFIM